MAKSLSIVIPAFNEERNITVAIVSVTEAIRDCVDDYEIIVVNDGSGDRTGEIAEDLKAKDTRLRVLHNIKNMGFGYSYRTGMTLACKDYIGIFPGDNDMSALVLRDLIAAIGQADLITSYMATMRNRSFLRRLLSRSFVFVLNQLFGLKMKYFNGSFICRLSLLRSIHLRSNGLTVIAEALIKLLKMGYSYQEICLEHTGRKQEKSKALTVRSFKETIMFLFFLIKDIYFESHPSPLPLTNVK